MADFATWIVAGRTRASPGSPARSSTRTRPTAATPSRSASTRAPLTAPLTILARQGFHGTATDLLAALENLVDETDQAARRTWPTSSPRPQRQAPPARPGAPRRRDRESRSEHTGNANHHAAATVRDEQRPERPSVHRRRTLGTLRTLRSSNSGVKTPESATPATTTSSSAPRRPPHRARVRREPTRPPRNPIERTRGRGS